MFDALTASLTYTPGDLNLFARYTYRDLSNEIVQTVTILPGFGGGQEFPFPALYESTLNLASGGLRYDFSPRFAAGADLTIYGNTGSFGVDWQQYRVFAQVTTPQGYKLRAAYRYNNYDEKDFNFDDYKANILTLSVGRSF